MDKIEQDRLNAAWEDAVNNIEQYEDILPFTEGKFNPVELKSIYHIVRSPKPGGICFRCGVKERLSYSSYCPECNKYIKQRAVKNNKEHYRESKRLYYLNNKIDLKVSNKLCKCGCGQLVNLATQTRRSRKQIKGEAADYIVGHHGIKPKVVAKRICESCSNEFQIYNKKTSINLVKCKKCRLNESRRERKQEVLKNIDRNCIVCQKQFSRKNSLENFSCIIMCEKCRNRTRAKNSRIKASDWYIRALICNNSWLQAEDIPQEMVDTYRLHLVLYRKVQTSKLKGEQYVEHERTSGSAVGPDHQAANG